MKRVLQLKALNFLFLLVGFFFTNISLSQNYYSMSSGNYSESFTAWSGYATNWNGQPALSTGTIPSATKTTVVSNGTMGVVGTGASIGYDVASSTKLVFLTTGSTDNSSAIACDLNLNFSGRLAGIFSFDAATIFNSTGGRNSTLRVYYTFDGTNWSELISSNLPYVATNNVAGSANILVQLPSVLDNKNAVTLRFYYHNGTGGLTGSRPKISIDNVSVTSSSAAAAPTIIGDATTAVFNTTFGTASAAQQFPVSGSNLTADLIATAPTGFEVSSDGTNYSSSATFIQTAGAASGTLYIRLSASAAVGTTIYDSQNIVLSSTGATAVIITTPASGNSVANAALQNQTISFATLAPVTYGVTPFTVNASASSGLTLFTYSSSNPAVATVFGNTVTVVGAGSAIITASQAGNSTYNPGSAQQTLVVNQKPVTIANASANNKVYDGTNTAVLSGNLTGIETVDLANVSVALTGTFASVDVADGIAVTSTSTLSGTAASNYSLTQPTGLLANITAAPQTISFSALAPKVVGEPLTLSAFSSTSSVNPISYTSSNPSVATISGNVVTILSAGSTSITASQGSSSNYAATQASQTLNVLDALAKWTFENPDFSATPSQTPALSVGTFQAEYGASITGSEFSGYHANANTVWSTPTGNSSSNSFSSNYWSVGDYLQFKVASQNFYNLSVSFDQTGSSTGPRDFKFQYSTDGINFTDFGADYIVYANASPNSWSGATYYSLFTNTINLNSISALNNLPFVYFRIVNTTTTSISNGTTALTGTSRVDNFTVTGSLCPTITPTFSLAPAATTCISNITAYTTQAGQFNYVWTIPGVAGTDYTIVTGGQSVSNSVAIQWLTTGPKTVTVSYANSDGCVSSVASTTTTIEPIPTFTVTNPAAVCAPATVNLNATVSNTALSYQFYTDANASTLYSTPTAATAGTYYIIGGNGSCYTAPQAVTVTVNALPTFTVTNPAAVCAPATVNLNATVSNTALSYQFYTDANATTLYTTPTAATAGTYYIIGVNGSCYTAPQAVTVTVNALPTFTVANPAAVCAPATVNLNSTVSNTALSYQFYTDANATSLYSTPTAATAGTYYVIGGNGTCYTAPLAVTVTVNALPTFTVTNPAAVCAPATVNLNATVSNTALSYQFYTDANATSLYTTPTAATVGTYYIIGGDGSCYTAPQAVTVTVNPLPTFTVTNPAAVCAPATVNLNTTVSNTALSYQFYTDANATSLYTTPTAATVGTYYIIGGDGSCYTAPQAVTVTVNPLPTFTVTNPAAVCAPATVNLNATVSNTALSYQFYTDANATSLYSTPTAATAGTYYVIGGNGTCYTAPQAVTVTVNSLPTFTVTNPAAVCAPATVNLNATVSNTALSYQFYTDVNATSLYTTPTAATAGTYYIIGGDGSCYTAPQAVTVTVNPLPIVATITGATTLDVNASTNLASTTPGGVWSSSNTAVATVNPNGVLTGVTQGTVTIIYTVTSGGCSNSQSVLVTVNALGVSSFDRGSLVFYPNPTQDIINFTYKDSITEIAVYNVLGQIVLQTVPNATSTAVNVSNLAVGTYLVKLFSGQFFTTFRILKN